MVLLILRNYHIDEVCNISGFDLTFQKLFLSLGDIEFFFLDCLKRSESYQMCILYEKIFTKKKNCIKELCKNHLKISL